MPEITDLLPAGTTFEQFGDAISGSVESGLSGSEISRSLIHADGYGTRGIMSDKLYGTDVIPDDGSLFGSEGTWFVQEPVTEDSVLNKFTFGTVTTAGVVFKVRVLSESGGSYTLEREHEFTTVLGLNEVDLYLKVNTGEFVGCYIVGGASLYNGTDATSHPLHKIVDIEIGETSAITASATYPIHWEFFIEKHVPQDNAERITKVESATSSAILGLPFKYNLVLGVGQSLMAGSYTDGLLPAQDPITTTQKYDTLCFAGRLNTHELYPATVANSEVDGRGEWHGLGFAEYLKELMSHHDNLDPEGEGNTIVLSNDGYGGSDISQISKGGSRGTFEIGISKVSELAKLTDDNSGVIGVNFMQGETIDSENQQGYVAAVLQLARDYSTDIKATNGQQRNIPFFMYQLSTDRAQAIFQLELSLDNVDLIAVTPMYHLSYYNAFHIDAISQRIVGAYFAKAHYQTHIKGLCFEPLRPVDMNVLGNTIVVTYNKGGLIFDTTTDVPQNTDNGFYVKDESLVSKTIVSTEVINSNQVRITMSEAPGSGWKVGYGIIDNTKPNTTICATGNLRDRDGDVYTFDGFPLHNWCVINDIYL